AGLLPALLPARLRRPWVCPGLYRPACSQRAARLMAGWAGAALGQAAGQLPVFCLAVLLVMTEPGLGHGRLRGRTDQGRSTARPAPDRLGVVPLPARERHDAEGKIMRVFVTGAAGALGRHLVPGLVAAGHEVTATTRTPGRAGQLRGAGAKPVIL